MEVEEPDCASLTLDEMTRLHLRRHCLVIPYHLDAECRDDLRIPADGHFVPWNCISNNRASYTTELMDQFVRSRRTLRERWKARL